MPEPDEPIEVDYHPEKLLETGRRYHLKVPARPRWRHRPGGSFDPERTRDRQGDLGNRLELEFRLDPPCADPLWVVATYYIVNDETGDRLAQPSEGDDRYRRLRESEAPLVDALNNVVGGMPPRDSEAVDGAVVDAPPLLFGEPIVANECPGWPATAQPDAQRVTSYDQPNFLIAGHSAHFETVVVKPCGRQRYETLGSLRWVYEHPDDDTHTSRLLRDGEGLDWGRPSDSFRRAVNQWLGSLEQRQQEADQLIEMRDRYDFGD